MQIKKLFGLKKGMRTVALGLAAMLTVGSLNVMDVEAAGTSVTFPQYKEGVYEYNSGDIFFAATHVHFFAETVTTTAHTHGNVMALDADLSEIGMRDGKISYPQDYREIHYVGNSISGLGSTINGDMIFGAGITYAAPNVTLKDGTVVDASRYIRGNISQDANANAPAVDILKTLDDLKKLSGEWAGLTQTTGVDCNITADMNNRYIDTKQTTMPNTNVVINIPYANWTLNTNPITIKGLDSNVANKGIVIINIDMATAGDNAKLTLNEIKAVDAQGNYYTNSEHTTAVFGSCRVVYNLIDSSKDDKVYAGNVEFSGTVYGNILAPGANVTVGAINGNVMAKSIVHTGQESHRLDIYPIFTANTDSSTPSYTEYDEIRLNLIYKVDGVKNNQNGKNEFTTYSLCTYDPTTQSYVPVVPNSSEYSFSNLNAEWNKDDEKYEVIISSDTVTKAVPAGDLKVDTKYYLVKQNIYTGYTDNDTVFEVVINADGSVKYMQCKEAGAVQESTTYTTSVLTDILDKTTVQQTPANDKIVINVEFSGPNAGEPTDADGGNVKYQVYSDPDCKTEVTGVQVSISKDTQGNWKAEFGEDLTKDLAKNIEYYIAVDNGSTFKDESADIYKVKFDADGTTLYYDQEKDVYDKDAIPTDKLIKNEGLVLDVVFEGEQPEGDDSKVVYKVYDETGAELSNIPAVEATDSDDNDVYEVVVDSADTTENMKRGEKYYIGIAGNDSGYTDKSEDKYWVIFDDNGNATYSTDPNAPADKWVDGPLEDVLYKTTTPGDGGESTKEPENKEIVINVVFSGPDGTNPADNSGVKYEIYEDSDADGNGDTVVPNSTTEAVKTDNGWKVEFSEDITKDLEKDKDYYVKVSDNGSDYKDVKEDVYKVKFDTDGNTLYDDPSTTDGYTPTVPTDKLIKNEGLALDVVFEGEQPEGTDSKVTYGVYEEDGTPVTTTPVEAKNTDDDKAFELVVDSEFTTENMDRNTPYYIEITNNGNDSHIDISQDKYWVKFDDNGNAKYSTDKDAPADEWVDGPLKDILIPSSISPDQPYVPNGKVELKVEFSGPDGTNPTDNSGVKYEIYEDCDANGKVSNPVPNSTTEAVKTGNGWKVEFDENITSTLPNIKEYYVKVSDNGSGYKDVSEDVYKVKFEPTTGKTQYYDPATGKYTTTVPTDKLIKNEGLVLDVIFKGEQPTGTDSNVTYDVYDKDGNKVTTTPIKAADSDGDKDYEVVVDPSFTTDKLDRDKTYYIGISDNKSNYTDESKDKYWVKFDGNGNVSYSKDGNTWQDTPMQDVLVKETTSSNPGSSNSGSNNPGSSNSGSNNTGSNNSGSNSNTSNATSNSNTGSVTTAGSNGATSPKTGEDNTALLFMGLAVVSAIAAGAVAYRKRRA